MSLHKQMHPHSKAFQNAEDINVLMLARSHQDGIYYNGKNPSRSSVKRFTDALTKLCENPSCEINRESNGCEFIHAFCVIVELYKRKTLKDT